MNPGENAQPATSVPGGLSGSARLFASLLGLGQICSWGTLYYCFPLIATAMETDLGWSKSELYGALTFGLILAAALTYPVGMAVDRGYGRVLMAASSLVAAGGLLAWSFVQSVTMFFALTGLLGALQATLLYEPAFAIMARRVGPLSARSGITLITLWGGFASTVFIPIEQVLLDHWGWRASLWVLAGVNAAWALGYLWLVRPELDVLHASSAGGRAAHAARDREAVRQAVRGPVFWLLLAAMSVYAVAFSAFTFHMYPMLQELKLDPVEVVQSLAVIGPAQVAGRILITIFASRAPMRVIGSVVISVFPFGFFLLARPSPSFGLVAVLIAAYGLANGIFTIVRGLVVPEMVSRHAYGAINGLLILPMAVGRAVAPVAAAWLWAVHQSYHLVIVAIAWSAVLLVVMFWLANWVSQSRRLPP